MENKDGEQKLTGLALLRKPFEKHQISKLPKPYSKDSPKGKCNECGGYHGLPAVHLDYVGHAALTDRLLEADPNWTWEPLSTKDGLPLFDLSGGLWIKLTICGVTRLGYGHAEKSDYKEIGSREKEVIGDALRNAAMRFGAALDLWHKGDLHGLEEENEVEKSQAQKNVEQIAEVLNETGFDRKSVSQEQSKFDINKYVIKSGKYKTKTFPEVDFHDLCGYLDQLKSAIEKGIDGQPMKPATLKSTKELEEMGRIYVAQFTQRKTETKFDDGEKIPF